MTFPSFHILRFSPLVSVRSYKYSCTLYYCVSFRYLPVLVPPFSIFIFSSLALQFFSTHFFFVLSCFLVPQFSLRPPFFSTSTYSPVLSLCFFLFLLLSSYFPTFLYQNSLHDLSSFYILVRFPVSFSLSCSSDLFLILPAYSPDGQWIFLLSF